MVSPTPTTSPTGGGIPVRHLWYVAAAGLAVVLVAVAMVMLGGDGSGQTADGRPDAPGSASTTEEGRGEATTSSTTVTTTTTTVATTTTTVVSTTRAPAPTLYRPPSTVPPPSVVQVPTDGPADHLATRQDVIDQILSEDPSIDLATAACWADGMIAAFGFEVLNEDRAPTDAETDQMTDIVLACLAP